MDVLVTDGTFKHSLAAVRALGRLGHNVDVLSHRRGASAAHSRYCRRSYVGPSPRQADVFVDCLRELLGRGGYHVLLPISYLAMRAVSEHREALMQFARFLLPNRESFEIAANKDETFRHAMRVNVPIPKTFWPQVVADLPQVAEACGFPLVIKPTLESGAVSYVNNYEDLRRKFEQLVTNGDIKAHPPVVQEYVRGEGYGFFALFHQGRVCAQFMHHRLLEYPVTGGPSVKAESVHDQYLEELGTRLLSSLDWNGVAMVEFKRDEATQECRLMEINPKFWGSLDLAIASGVNFPDLYCRAALGEDIPPQSPYEVGLQFRWMVRESLFNTLSQPQTLGSWIRDSIDPQVSTDVDWSDWHPHLYQLGAAIAELAVRAAKGTLFRPHGCPRMEGKDSTG
jgi:predicted ATP-grasp superfamily ATP-dependent carboligase